MLDHDDVPGAGTPLLFIPGFAGDRREFAAQVQYFGGRCRVVTVDPPLDGDVTIAGQADRVAELIRATGLHGCVTIGHSQGGLVALAVADRHPDLVSGVILLDSLVQVPAVSRYLTRAALLILLTPVGRPALLRFFAQGFSAHDDETLRAEVLARVARVPRRQAWTMTDSMFAYDAMPRLRSLRVPFRYVRATLDTDPARLPPGVLATISDAGHWVHRQAPAATNALIEDLLARVTARG